jgi:alpha-tubulin suppressor-like RCC1 family protein
MFFRGVKVSIIALGWYHSMIASEDGVVYGFGGNDVGQLGLGYMNDLLLIPTKVDFFNGIKITAISLGYEFSMVLSSRGLLYTFGVNSVWRTKTNR